MKDQGFSLLMIPNDNLKKPEMEMDMELHRVLLIKWELR